MSGNRPARRMPLWEAQKSLNHTLKTLHRAYDLMKKLGDMHVDSQLIKEAIPQFILDIQADQKLYQEFIGAISSQIDIRRNLHVRFFKFLQSAYPDRVGSQFKALVELCDVSDPAAWFPEARLMKRKIIMHVGPTNSGKTYSALKRLKSPETKTGIYCGPLRLLAHEVRRNLW